MIDARIVDLVEDAVAQREPDATVATDGSADAALGARRPARREAGPARGERLRLFGSARNRADGVASVVTKSSLIRADRNVKVTWRPARMRTATSYLTRSIAVIVGWNVQT